MNAKSLTLLIVVTLIVVIAAITLTNQGNTVTEKQKLLPELMSALNDITTIEVTTANDKFSLIRDDKQWVLPEKHQYPADMSKIRQILVGAAELTVLEAKTAKPELYTKIGVADVTEKDSTAILLTLKKQDDTVANILVGTEQFVADSDAKEIYVRKAGEAQSWLVNGNLSIDKAPIDWLNKSVTNIKDERIHEVVITHGSGEKLRIFRESEENQDYQLADLPENKTLSSPYLLKQIATFLNSLNMEDVTVADEVTFDAKDSTQAVFKTFDGLEITVTLQAKEGKQYARLSAVAGEPVIKPEVTESTDEKAEKSETTPTVTIDKTAQVKNEVADLNKQLNQWVYVLPSYKVDNLLKKSEDLVKSVEEQGDLSDIVNTNLPKGLENLLKPPSALANPTTTSPESALGNPVTTSD